jgi:hypothetical protein
VALGWAIAWDDHDKAGPWLPCAGRLPNKPSKGNRRKTKPPPGSHGYSVFRTNSIILTRLFVGARSPRKGPWCGLLTRSPPGVFGTIQASAWHIVQSLENKPSRRLLSCPKYAVHQTNSNCTPSDLGASLPTKPNQRDGVHACFRRS